MTVRDLPSVESVAVRLEGRFPRKLVVEETRRVLARVRPALLGGAAIGASVEELVCASLERLRAPSLRRVINATGTILHTNLGRAPLAPFGPVEGYSNLEYDVAAGRRGRRDVHVSDLLERLAGRPGIVVNNNAAAVWLVLNELAGGGEAIVSRGELIEIGDGFRIPDIMARSGAVLREAGTTNRTRAADYAAAINERTRMLMRVHPSNFRIAGFTERPALDELAALARERGLVLYEDTGSGCLMDLRPFGIDEPVIAHSFESGANVATFSGDKLLGGPQAGLICGDGALLERIRRNPMFRALRVDKLIYAALETTLRLILFEEYDSVPALRMLRESASSVRSRAEAFAARLGPGAGVVEGRSVAGGGSTPDQSLPTWLVAIAAGQPNALEAELRRGDPPVVARIENDRLLLDLRTVARDEENELLEAVKSAYARST